MNTMLDYINEESKIAKHIIDVYKNEIPQLASLEDVKKILILATGSSYNAVLSMKLFLERDCRIILDIREPFQFAEYEEVPTDIDLVIGVSQRGTSLSTIRAVNKIKNANQVPIIAVTSILNSPLTEYVDLTVDILCGIETVGYSTMGVHATLITLCLIGIHLSNHTQNKKEEMIIELEKVVSQIDQTISISKEFYSKIQDQMNKICRFSFIGYGANLGTVKEAETKFTETVRVPSQGFELEAYMHGPIFELKKNYGVFLVQYDQESYAYERSLQLEKFTQEYCENVFVIEMGTIFEIENERLRIFNPSSYLSYSPILEIIPFQVFSYLSSKDRGVDLASPVFPDFRKKLGSKVGEKDKE